MRFSSFIFCATLVVTVLASWFSPDKPVYTHWDSAQLRTWLRGRGIEPPTGFTQKELQTLVKLNWNTVQTWTQEQYDRAQHALGSIRDDVFDTWGESQLRDFLLEQGVVAPSGPREKLVVAAKQHYQAFTSAASSIGSSASAAASSAAFGDRGLRASSLASSAHEVPSSAIVQASETLARALDDSKDYVYSTWSDKQLRKFLEEKGVLKPNDPAPRDQLLLKMRDAYSKATRTTWSSWSDSYIHEWLVTHGIIKSDHPKLRSELVTRMGAFYYHPLDSVYSTWSESQLRQWLINHGIIKSDVQMKKDKLLRLVEDNYASAADTIWSSWSDSDIRDWLIEHGHLPAHVQKPRDELIKLMHEKNHEARTRTAAYLTWPDARLRAFLRSNGLSEEHLPTSRPGLLQETRIRYVQASTKVEQIYTKLQTLIASGVHTVEETIGQILEVLSGAHKRSESEYERGKVRTKEMNQVSGKLEKQTEKVRSEL